MKICDLTPACLPGDQGVRIYLEAKQNYIRRHPHHQGVLIVSGDRSRVERNGNITTYQVGSPPVFGIKAARLWSRLDRIIEILRHEKPHIVELGSPLVLPQAGFYCRRRFASVLVGFYHCDFPPLSIEPRLRPWVDRKMAGSARILAEKYVRYIYNRFDATMTSSRALLRKLKRLGLHRVRSFHPGVDPEFFNPGRRSNRFRNSLGLRDGDRLLIYKGPFDRPRRVDVLLEAFSMISDHFQGRLLMIGDGPARDRIMRAARRNSKLHYVPIQSDRGRLAEILASGDIYVTAEPHPVLGFSILEALSSGLSVIGVDAGELREKVSDEVSVLLPPDSPTALARGIMRLAYGDYRRMGRRARAFVEDEYSWQKTFSKLFRFYRSLIRRKGQIH